MRRFQTLCALAILTVAATAFAGDPDRANRDAVAAQFGIKKAQVEIAKAQAGVKAANMAAEAAQKDWTTSTADAQKVCR